MSVIANTPYEFHKLAVLMEQVESARESGRFVCQKARHQALIYIEAGEIVHATYDTLVGEEVLYALLSWNGGTVHFEPKNTVADFDTSHTIAYQQTLIFKQTLELVQPPQTNIAITPPSLEALSYRPEPSPAPARPAPAPNYGGANYQQPAPAPNYGGANYQQPTQTYPAAGNSFGTETRYSNAPAPEVATQTGPTGTASTTILMPPISSLRPAPRLQNTLSTQVIQQAGSESLTGYLSFTVKVRGQEETALLVMEQGTITTARYSTTNNQLLSGQAAYDAIIKALNTSDVEANSFESEAKWIKPFRALVGNQIVQSYNQATTALVVQQVQDLVQSQPAAALRLSGQKETFCYLLTKGEVLGYFETIGNNLELISVPFPMLTEENRVRLDVLLTPNPESIDLGANKFVGSSNNFNPAQAPGMGGISTFTNGSNLNQPAPARANPAPANSAAFGSDSGSGVGSLEQSINWYTILEKGRRPYSSLQATTTNFNGLRRAFEQKFYTGVIEITSPNYQLHYLIEKGVPVGMFKPEPYLRQHIPSNVSIFEVLDKTDFYLNVYLEANKVSTQIFFENYVQALQEGAFNRAVQVVQEALRTGMKPEVIYDAIFTGGMRQVGVLWQTGKMTVAQEHLATGITEYCRSLVVSSTANVPVKRIGRVLLTSVSENSHTLGLNLLSDVFRWHGWEVFPMFSELPDVEIVDAALRHQVDMVCLSASLPGQIVKAMKAINALRQSGWKGLISVGGAAFVHSPETFKSTGADILGVDTESTVESATRLLTERLNSQSN